MKWQTLMTSSRVLRQTDRVLWTQRSSAASIFRTRLQLLPRPAREPFCLMRQYTFRQSWMNRLLWRKWIFCDAGGETKVMCFSTVKAASVPEFSRGRRSTFNTYTLIDRHVQQCTQTLPVTHTDPPPLTHPPIILHHHGPQCLIIMRVSDAARLLHLLNELLVHSEPQTLFWEASVTQHARCLCICSQTDERSPLSAHCEIIKEVLQTFYVQWLSWCRWVMGSVRWEGRELCYWSQHQASEGCLPLYF